MLEVGGQEEGGVAPPHCCKSRRQKKGRKKREKERKSQPYGLHFPQLNYIYSLTVGEKTLYRVVLPPLTCQPHLSAIS